MHKLVLGMALAAVSAAATAQDGGWGFYEPGDGTMQAGIAGENGSQLILKCDKPGKRKVYAVVVSPTALAAAKGASGFESREVRLVFDGGAPLDDQWRFNDTFAMAMDDTNLRAMTRFGEKIVDARKLEVLLKPFQKPPVELTFDVTGARAAMERVYRACKDEAPFD